MTRFLSPRKAKKLKTGAAITGGVGVGVGAGVGAAYLVNHHLKKMEEKARQTCLDLHNLQEDDDWEKQKKILQQFGKQCQKITQDFKNDCKLLENEMSADMSPDTRDILIKSKYVDQKSFEKLCRSKLLNQDSYSEALERANSEAKNFVNTAKEAKDTIKKRLGKLSKLRSKSSPDESLFPEYQFVPSPVSDQPSTASAKSSDFVQTKMDMAQEVAKEAIRKAVGNQRLKRSEVEEIVKDVTGGDEGPLQL